MSRWLAAALAVLLLALPVAPAATAAAPPGPAADSATLPSPAAGPVGSALAAQGREFDHTTFVITAHANGSARWTFRYTRILDNESERENFEAYADAFNENETDLYRSFRERASQLTAQGTNATGREMNATAFAREAFVTTGATADQGVVRLSFRWRGFGSTDGESVAVGDVFEGGLYLGTDQWLRVEPGPDLAFASVTPEPDAQSPGSVAVGEADSITWEGERQFAHQNPAIQLAPPEAVGGSGTAGPDWLPVLAGTVVLLLGVGAAAAWRRGALGGDGDVDAGGVTVDEHGESVGPTGEVEGDPAVPDEELLTDESRVVQLLEDNGGRMKQVQIVDETGWSKSKVSMLLSDMETADEISKLRVGRENVISLKGHEPDAAKSPFEDDESPDERAS